MFTPYDLVRTDIGYQFRSDFGLIYILYFSNYYLLDENGDDAVVSSFGFYHIPKDAKVNDPRIKATIIRFITDYFEKNPESGVLYICDPKDNLARHRRIIFGSWHKEVSKYIEKFDCKAHHARLGYYTSILVRIDNPQKQYFVDAFYRSLEDSLPEDI